MKEEKKEKWKERLCIVLTSVLLPCILTLLISGTSETAGRKISGIIIEMDNGTEVDAEEFLLYMIAGQMELDVHREALKAQSVIARTNLMRELAGKKKAKASELNLTYLTTEKYENSFGKIKKEEVSKKLNQIISSTYPYVLTYEGKYIEALYHCVSIGTTVSAEEVFGKGRAYLIEVDSSHDVESEESSSPTANTSRNASANGRK